jgi:hypothetical protein
MGYRLQRSYFHLCLYDKVGDKKALVATFVANVFITLYNAALRPLNLKHPLHLYLQPNDDHMDIDFLFSFSSMTENGKINI